jgi:hypothetical protein
MNQNKMGHTVTGKCQDESKELAHYGKEKTVAKHDTTTEKEEEKLPFHLSQHGIHLLQFILAEFKNVRLNCMNCDIFNVNLKW